MDQNNLQTASTYINNILLARGLLKTDHPIDFAHPENDEGGIGGTMARVINLVNDLVLRRDREAEHRENLATTIRALRATESQQTMQIGKLTTKTAELSRSVALAEAQERALKTNMSSAEATIRGLKEQVQRMKTSVQQVRAQCANDIRKRDLELQKLKTHLADRQRGKREGLGVTTININPVVDKTFRNRSLNGGEGVHEPGYTLKQETTEFLTELCQNLSNENDSLIVLARSTVGTLKELQGLPLAVEEMQCSTGSTRLAQNKFVIGPVDALPTSCEQLSNQMEKVLDHLRMLLTNPSFVSLEEVEIRDEEIKRLRDGWEKMETRWTQAVTMMDGWHKRISDGGGSVQIDELRLGLELNGSLHTAHDLADAAPDSDACPAIYEDDVSEEEVEVDAECEMQDDSQESTPSLETPNETKDETASKPLGRTLVERSDNIGLSKSPRKVSFDPGLTKATGIGAVQEDETLPIKAYKSEAVTQRHSKKRLDFKASRQDLKGTRMTVPQKLAAAEIEAKAAERARKEVESRKRGRAAATVSSRGKRNRRRSTLTHDELEGLIGAPSS